MTIESEMIDKMIKLLKGPVKSRILLLFIVLQQAVPAYGFCWTTFFDFHASQKPSIIESLADKQVCCGQQEPSDPESGARHAKKQSPHPCSGGNCQESSDCCSNSCCGRPDFTITSSMLDACAPILTRIILPTPCLCRPAYPREVYRPPRI